MSGLPEAGAPPQKSPRYAPLFIDKEFSGLWTQRSALHDPSSVIESKFYGGRPDSIWDGLNIELSNNLTLQRRPGLTPFSIATYPTPPNRAFSFQILNGTIRVIIDTGSTPTFSLSGVQEASGVSYYFFTTPQPTAANNTFTGLIFQITGFGTGSNNGAFTCISSTSTYLILNNPQALTDGTSGNAISSGAVYWDQQNGGPSYSLAAVDVISGVAYYHFTTPQSGAVSNGFVGDTFVITGFDQTNNNGTFTCTSSTSAYMVLVNAAATTDTAAALATSTDKVLLFAKSPGAGQTYFVAVAGVLYMGDGVDIRKYTPMNSNETVWNWGTNPPTTQPSVSIVASGSAAIAWVANTIFSTMGLIVDPNNNTQQLISVNATGLNPPPATLGTSGNGFPNFNTATGSTTIDGGVTWTSEGPITLWTANTLYQPDQPIYDPTTNCIFIQSHTNARTSGPSKPLFNSTLGLGGARVDDTNSAGVGGGNARWENMGVVNGSPTGVLTWKKNTHFNQYTPAGGGMDPTNTNSSIVFPLVPNNANLTAYANGTGPAIYFLGATTAGTTANTNYTPWTGIPKTGPGSQIPGSLTMDFVQGATTGLEWLCLGSATWQAFTPYSQWTAQGSVFSAIYDGVNMQVCTVGGTSGATIPAVWGSNYGSLTNDNGISWVCVGPPVTWAINTQWDLPVVGFSPPSPSQPFGGAEVIGNAFVQSVISSGKSGVSTPSWGTPPVIGNTVTDSGITWETVAAYSQNSVVWTTGHVYAYSYESRLASDPYNTTAPPGLNKPLGPPTGSETGLISTASPVFTITGANTGAVNTVSGIGSTDPQIDTIVIWRDADGGGPDNMFFLTEIPAPQPVAGVAQPWSFQDFLPDLPTSTFPGLNNLIPAPINQENNPPPNSALPQVYNFQRIWFADGSSVLFTGGPDVITGNPNESVNPADEFPYLAPVVRLVKTSQGLVTFLTDSIEFIAGGPITSSFYQVTLAPGIGLANYNGLDVYGGEIYFFSADGQFKVLTPSLSLTNAGAALGDKFANFNASKVQIAVQQSGVDNCVMVADGSTGWYRLNPQQFPGSYAGPGPVWSPFAAITNGCQMVQSVEVSTGIKKLLVGSTQPNQPILERNLSVFQDNNINYDSFFVIGSITLCHPGQIGVLKFLELELSGVNFQPNVSYLLNEINTPQGSGTFTSFTLAPQFDPPSIYGSTISPVSYSPQRYYFSGTGSLARARHLQIRVDYGVNNVGSELFGLTIFGKLMVEG